MHIVTGVINKEPYFKPNPMGSDMYGVELYEVNTDKGGNKVYTNYKAFIFAKSDGQKAYFKQNIQKGAFIVIQSDTLMPDIYMPQHGDQPRVTMLMQGAKVKAVNGGQQQQNHQPQQQGGWGQPQQPQQQGGWGQPQQQQPRQPQQQYSEPPMNFDDENPMG